VLSEGHVDTAHALAEAALKQLRRKRLS
jgi:hypothetical protein